MTPQPDLDAIHATRARLRATYLRPADQRPASTARGLHHTALISSDVERTIRFYQDLLGFPLTELIENRDYPGSSHFFFDIGNGNLLAFFDFPGLDVGPYAEVLGGLHHVAISRRARALAGARGAARRGRRRARGAQRGLGLLPRPRRRPHRADRRPARRDVRRARALSRRDRPARATRGPTRFATLRPCRTTTSTTHDGTSTGTTTSTPPGRSRCSATSSRRTATTPPTRSTRRWRSSADGIRAVKVSLVVLLVTALRAGRRSSSLTGSVALLADTIHNFSDALTAVPLWLAFALGRRSPDPRATPTATAAPRTSPGVFIVAMIAALRGRRRLRVAHAGCSTRTRSATRGWSPRPGSSASPATSSSPGYRIRVGRRIGSAALVADGLHARTDGFTSLAVVAGAVGVLLGFPLADPLDRPAHHRRDPRRAALRGPRHLPAADGRRRPRAGRRRPRRRCCRPPASAASRSCGCAGSGTGCAPRPASLVDPGLDLRAAHEIAHDAEDRLRAGVPRLDAVTVHVSPELAAPATLPASLTDAQ